MNLNEDIKRIKQVMGINESVINAFKRRIYRELPEQIRSTYYWLYPKRFDSLEQFIDSVAFSVARDMLANIPNITYEMQLEHRDEIKEFIEKEIYKNYYEEVTEYYKKEKRW